MDFNLSIYFNGFDVDKEYTIDIHDVDAKIDEITGLLANNCETINVNGELLEDLIELIHGYRSLEGKHQKQLAYLVTSSFNMVGQQLLSAIGQGDFVEIAESFKMTLEKYGYLIFLLLTFLGKEDHGSAHAAGAKSKGSNSTQAVARWRANCTQVEDALSAISNVFQVDLAKIFVTTPEKNLFIEIFTRPIFHLMELPERMKVVSIKTLMFKSIAYSVKYHGHGNIVQNSILQCLTYYIHLAHYMAELLHDLAANYDYSGLTEEVLREISQIEFNSNDNNGPKSISEFLIKLSELSPRLILKQMSCIAQLLDNSNQTLRCSVVETCGNIVVDSIRNKDDASNTSYEDNSIRTGYSDQQIHGLSELLEERFLDQNPYVRTKAIQALTKISSLSVNFSLKKQKIMLLAVRSLEDRSTLVRRNAVKLMAKILLGHPFSAIHGDQLSYKLWKPRLDAATKELEALVPPSALGPENENGKDDDDDMEIDEKPKDDDDEREENMIDGKNDDDNGSDHAEEEMFDAAQLPDRTTLAKAKLTLQYYQDAISFIETIEKGTDVVSRLLYSKNRNEVLESMDFLVLADAFGIENAHSGIRRMLHLVWMKGSSDEGKSICSHLIDCYKDLFLVAPSSMNSIEQSAYIAKNLILLTYSASAADLASLEKLLCLMYDDELIKPEVIQILWQIYNAAGKLLPDNDQLPVSTAQFRGSIIILGMLALADQKIVLKGLDGILNIGLGEKGMGDLVLAKYSCITLQRAIPNIIGDKDGPKFKFAREEEATIKLRSILLYHVDNTEWYSMAEEALSAVYLVSSKPDIICADIIKAKSLQIFDDESSNDKKKQIILLCQLLFVVGHVAIKTIVHLEKLETIFKKKKHDNETKKNNPNAQDESQTDNELEMIGGTTEDDFTDAVIYIKERELLYGESSLLAKFGPLVREICLNNVEYNNESLQRSAVLCLAKLMCVSSKYCEDNLPLLITIMEKSPDPIVRSNCVLGLGDMAVCFNNLVDENTDFLYRRLTDENLMVQKTCLMTVTFLILAGQVKVKGQLSSMAKCLENEDNGISDMCKLFFTELATKDNAIYNGFIDIFSGLSSDKELPKDSMKRIVKFLVGFIEKEKHQKQLAEKLLVRLSKCQNESQWNDIVFVLNSIPYKNENIINAIEQGYKMVLSR